MTRARRASATLAAALLFGMLFAGAPAARAYQGSAPAAQASEPITTGANPEKMDAGSTDAQLENYRHSNVVKTLAGWLHQPVERTATLLEDFNSAVLILIILYFLAKYVPGSFRAKREAINKDLVQARSASEMADERLKAVERRLASLDGEIEALRQKSAADVEGDRQRIEASLEAERARIVNSAEAEIAAAGAQAQRELKKFAADLAVERALSRISLTPEQDQALIDEFTTSLGAQLSQDGRRN